MTREEEIRNAADEAYPTWEEYNIGFIEGAKWADQYPKDNLVDIDKAWNWLTSQKGERTIDDFKRAMKGE